MDQFQLFDLALKVVPIYDGNVNSLYRFLNITESVVKQYYDPEKPKSFQNVVVINGIIGKLRGKALEAIDINAVNSWTEIKHVLVQNFADQRDENSLNRDLINLTQGNESPQQFYDRCMSILNTLINYINVHNHDDAIIMCKRDFFTTQTLKTFLAGLKEPLGSTIRAMRPDTLPIALQYIKEENNIIYLQKRHQGPSTSNNNGQNNNNKQMNFMQNQNRASVPNWQNKMNNNQQFYSNKNQQNFNRNRQNYYQNNSNFNQNRQNFNMNRPQQNPNKSNYFYQDPRYHKNPKPTPMSGVSHSNNNQGQMNANNSPRFIPNNNYRPQYNPNEPNPFKNVGHYPDYIFEELNHNNINNDSDFDPNMYFEDQEQQNYPSEEFSDEFETDPTPSFDSNLIDLEQNFRPIPDAIIEI